jgi:hypothetical protein
MSKPVWVQVIWSESSRFKDNELIPFADFENRAFKVAMKVGYGKGYDKTKVNILFDDGNEYQCRLDLAPYDTHGFEHHAKKFISWYEKQQDDSSEQDLYADNYNFMKQIEWPSVPYIEKAA